MNMANFGEDTLAVKRREPWIWEAGVIQEMVSEQNSVVDALYELGMASSFKEGFYKASLSFQLHILNS